MKHQLISGETLLNTYSKGNPEGSRSDFEITIDPVTTDPKGEARRMCARRWLLVNKRGPMEGFYNARTMVYNRIN